MSKDLKAQEIDPKGKKGEKKSAEKDAGKSANVVIRAESDTARREEEVFEFWQENNIFEKSLEKESPKGEFVFYDGPPFATGLPHYGHILPGTIKDVIPRYKTMQGYHVRRQWGWDCHGLPVENLVEKELGINTKKEIEEYGIDKFNEQAENSVLRYRDDWRKIIPRTGRWVDMENDYKTMDPTYTETEWWIFKSLFDKGLVYEGFKSMHLCPRCETTLSNFEVNLGYADLKDLSVTVRLPLKNEKDTSLLVWTTTPWTLPGNMAAGVNAGTEYVKVESEGEAYLLAKEALERVFEGKEYKEIETKKGSELVGLEYEPPFPYFLDKDIENKENAWKVYAADYVTTEDGTGIVHLAPAFGEEDLSLAQENNIPIVHHVKKDGTFTDAVTDFAGQKVKPKDTGEHDHMETDIEIVKWLAHHGKLFSKEKITHSYPLCWRCDTPLLNYATTGWFISVTKMKDKLLSANASVNWVPKEIGTGRMGKWLEGAHDWNVSRARYWGAPLPVWRDEETGEMVVVGSLDELREKSNEALTKITAMRHAESEKNIAGVLDSSIDLYDLTEKGVEEAKEAAKNLKGKVDVIYASPVLRARRTAEIIGESLGLDVEIADDIMEIKSGEWENKTADDESIQKEREQYENLPVEERYTLKRGTTGESWEEFDRRVSDFVRGAIEKHKGKSILFVGHQGVVAHVEKCIGDYEISEELFTRHWSGEYAKALSYTVHTGSKKRVDFHRPYIDEVVLYSEKGTGLRRIPDVFDTWYESGSMPYGQWHFPFENTNKFNPEENIGFPANFISEGVDQTRGWFYSLVVLATGLYEVSPYKNVIVHGMILAEDGKKMSKRLKNYPDPLDVINKYGADALRYYLLSSPVIRGEELWFSEKNVAEIMRKLIGRLENVRQFYELYRKESLESRADAYSDAYASEYASGGNPLDTWILARLSVLENEVRESIEAYKLDRATRPLMDFVDDLSTWYVRRSRDRFKGEDKKDGESARATLYVILKEFSKVIAPFMPFYADHLFRSIRGESDPESVHLSDWPELQKADESVLKEMSRVREVVSLALEIRSREGVKVRQPLAELTYGGEKLGENFEAIIADEVNVKKVTHAKDASAVELDLELTEDLKKEGMVRDLIRAIQGERKNQNLNPVDVITLSVSTTSEGEKVFKAFEDEIQATVNAASVDLLVEDASSEDDSPFSFSIVKTK